MREADQGTGEKGVGRLSKDRVEKPTEANPGKEPNGDFAKGNKIGNRFSKDNQPKHNPGRPPGSLTKVLRKLMESPASMLKGYDDQEGKTVADVFIEKAAEHAIEGNSPYFKELFNRLEGKLPETILGALGSSPLDEVDESDLDKIIAAGRPKEDDDNGEAGTDGE